MHVPRGLDYAPSVQRDPDLTKRHEAASAVWANKNQCRHVGCTKVSKNTRDLYSQKSVTCIRLCTVPDGTTVPREHSCLCF